MLVVLKSEAFKLFDQVLEQSPNNFNSTKRELQNAKIFIEQTLKLNGQRRESIQWRDIKIRNLSRIAKKINFIKHQKKEDKSIFKFNHSTLKFLISKNFSSVIQIFCLPKQNYFYNPKLTYILHIQLLVLLSMFYRVFLQNYYFVLYKHMLMKQEVHESLQLFQFKLLKNKVCKIQYTINNLKCQKRSQKNQRFLQMVGQYSREKII